MEFSNFKKEEILNNKKKIGDDIIKKQNINNNIVKNYTKTSLINIDSSYRNIEQKNITITSNEYLKTDPIFTTKDSNQLKINIKNHNFEINDLITIHNVVGLNKSLSKSFYLIQDLEFVAINIDNHQIPNDYTNYVDAIYIDIKLKSDLSTIFYNNISPISFTGIKKIFTFNDIKNTYENEFILSKFEQFIISYFNTSISTFSKNFIFIKIDIPFLSNDQALQIKESFNIQFLNLNGIHIKHINADYPLNLLRDVGNQKIVDIENDYIYIDVNSKAYSDGNIGGSKILISKITEVIRGYPNAADFSISLPKTFSHVTMIEMISSEFTYFDFIIEENINNKLYWQRLDTGNHVYSIEIPTGNYTINDLIDILNNKMNDVDVLNSDAKNIFTIDINSSTYEINFNSFIDFEFESNLFVEVVLINNEKRYKIQIVHHNHSLNVGDTIIIFNADSIGNISQEFINTSHEIYEVNYYENKYTILLPKLKDVDSSDSSANGGTNIIIRVPNKFRLLFNYDDTLGNILNFNIFDKDYAITTFENSISNFFDFNFTDNINITKSNNIFKFTGKDDYWLLYINDFDIILLNNQLESCFAKIQLAGNPGDTIYNSYINLPIQFNEPLSTLNELDIKVTDSKGNIVNYNGNFSFTLKIYEIQHELKNYRKKFNSNSFIDEVIS